MKKAFKSLLPVLLCWLCLLPGASAQQFTFPPAEESQKAMGADLKATTLLPGGIPNANDFGHRLPLVHNSEWTAMTTSSGWSNSYSFPVLYDVLSVRIDPEKKGIFPKYRYGLTFTLYKYNDPANPGNATTEPAYLEIEYDPAAGAVYKNEAVYKLQNSCYAFQAVLEKVEEVSNPGVRVPVNRNTIADNLLIETKVFSLRYDKQVSPFLVTGNSVVNNQLQIRWGIPPYTTSVPGCHAISGLLYPPYSPLVYELEWTYIDDYTYDITSNTTGHLLDNPSVILRYDFRHNATRIRTRNTSYAIPLTYERGAIIYRVRALRPDAAMQRLEEVVPWSVLPDAGGYDMSSGNCNVAADCYILPQAQQQDRFNWQYTASFAEDAKYKHVINYFDGLYKNRQNVTWLNSLHGNTGTDYVIAQEDVFDLEGRPVIKSLPIPLISSSLDYKPGLLTNNGGHVLSAADFDNPAARCTPVTIGALDAGAPGNGYYSPSNPDKSGMNNFIPDAGGYPYTQTIYSPDNTNKVMWQGGAGPQLQPGANGHAARFEYVRADQSQLNRLLGTEGGHAEFYPKQISIDANGQSSFSIFDPSGKVVATGLSGQEPGNGSSPSNYPIDPLPSKPVTVPAPTLRELLNGGSTQLLGNAVTRQTSFYNDVLTAAPAAVSHHATLEGYTLCSQVLKPQLKYTTRILDACGKPYYSNTSTIGTWSVSPVASGISVTTPVISGTAPSAPSTPPGLPAGKYIAESSVELDRDALRNQVSGFFDANSGAIINGTCYKDAREFIHDKIVTSTYPCEPASDDVPVNDCEARRLAMMKQLYPGAVYGQYQRDPATGQFIGGAANSIFTFTQPPSQPSPVITHNGNVTTTFTYTINTTVGNSPQCSVSCSHQSTVCTGSPGNVRRCSCGANQHDDYTPCCISCLKNRCECIRFHTITATTKVERHISACNLYDNPQGSINIQSLWGTFFNGNIPVCSVMRFNPGQIQSNGTYKACPGTGTCAVLLHESGQDKLINCSCGYQHLVKLFFVQDPGAYFPLSTKYVIATCENCCDGLLGHNMGAHTCDAIISEHTTTEPFSFRYQSQCLGPIKVNGTTYNNLTDIDPQLLIDHFDEDIAKALLPLHPEYCKLAMCDRYGEDIDQIKTYQDVLSRSQQQGTDEDLLQYLVNNDPLHINQTTVSDNDLMNVPDTRPVPQANPIDRLALKQAYCGAEQSAVYDQCADMYRNEIINRTIPAGKEDVYWQNLKALYIGNRNYQVYKKISSLGNGCGPCTEKRMQQSGQPVFGPQALDAGTWFNSPDAENPGPSDIPDEVRQLLNAATDPALAAQVQAQAQQKMLEQKQRKCDAIISGIIRQLGNCSGWTIFTEFSFASSLKFSLDYSNPDTDPELTPQMVKDAFDAAGVSPNDLCHPFLADYGFANSYGAKAAGKKYACKGDSYYAGMQAFLSRTDIRNLLANVGSVTDITLFSINPFESDVLSRLQYLQAPGNPPPSLHVGSHTYTAQNSATFTYLSLELNNPGGSPTGWVSLYFSDPALPATFAVNCFNEPSVSLLDSRISTNVVRLTAPGAADIYCWSPEMTFVNKLTGMNADNTLTCIDAQNGLSAFNADAAVFGYDPAANHPFFRSSLANYLNFKYKRSFAYGDYEGLLHGCAVSDLVVSRQHKGTLEMAVSNANAAAFYNDLKNYPDEQVKFYCLPDGGTWNFYIDFNSVTPSMIAAIRDGMVSVAAGPATYRPASPSTTSEVLVLGPPIPSGSSLPSLSWKGSNGNGQALPLDPNNAQTYACYRFPVSNASAQSIANDLEDLRAYLGTNLPGAVMLSDYKLWRAADYSSTNRQNYLQYIRQLALTTSDREAVVQGITPQALVGQVSAPSIRYSYEEVQCADVHRTLYLRGPNYPNPLVTGFQQLINAGAKPFDLGGNSSRVYQAATVPPATPGNELTVYKNSDGTYWMRAFSPARDLYSLYFTLPEHTSDPASWTSTGYTIEPSFTDDNKIAVSVTLSTPEGLLTCKGYLTGVPVIIKSKVSDVVLYSPVSSPCVAGEVNCEQQLLQQDIDDGKVAFDNYRTTIINNETGKYFNALAAGIRLYMDISLPDMSYHYTLYYYDQAGNVVRTVPPAGVTPLSLTDAVVNNARSTEPTSTSTAYVPANVKQTQYKYNSRNLPVWQKTPDGGETYFFYDAQGRLRFSQNSRQRPLGRYSYTLYDELSRVTEAGEVKLDASLAPAPADPTVFTHNLSSYSYMAPGSGSSVLISSEFYPYVRDADLWDNDKLNDVVQHANRLDVVRTLYDVPVATGAQSIVMWRDDGQQNLRNRVSSVQMFSGISGTSVPNWDIAVHFSYDAMGNVRSFIQDCPDLTSLNKQYIRVDYDYDLASGKINMLSYNRGLADQYYHRYNYDADNRLTVVETSSDGLVWDKDAEYEYYKHGPLARTRLGGDLRVQSIEYAYNIQGWLKSINGEVVRPENDMGQNGLAAGSAYPRDVMAHTLDYFPGDYSPIGSRALQYLQPTGRQLYNGNIVRQTTGMLQPANTALPTMTRNYQYDQLHRLRASVNEMVTVSGTGVGATYTLANTAGAYNSTYGYDPDGNILRLTRRDNAGQSIDDLTYRYSPLTPKRNWLTQVEDAVSTPSVSPDFHGHTSLANYSYDGAGNLTADAAEHKTISWNGWGKATSIYDPVKKMSLVFRYDGSGNRYQKDVTSIVNSDDHRNGEYYVRDPQGQILAAYRRHSVWNARTIFRDLGTAIGSTSAGTGILAAVGLQFPAGSDAVLAASVTEAATNDTWLRNRSNQTSIRDQIKSSPAAYDALMYGSKDYLDSMFRPGPDTLIIQALIAAQEGADGILENLLEFDTPAHRALNYLCSRGGTSHAFIAGLAEEIGLPQSDSCEVLVNSIYDAYHVVDTGQVAQLPPPAPWVLAGKISQHLLVYQDDAAAFYEQLVHDQEVFQELLYASAPFEAELRQLIRNDDANPDEIIAYIDQWPQARSVYNAHVDNDVKAQALFNFNPEGYVSEWMSVQGTTDVLTDALAASGLAPGTFVTALKGVASTRNINVNVIDEASSVAKGLGADSLLLSEHHIYGSSRLGVKSYGGPSLQLFNSWNVDNAVGSKVYLNAPQGWYRADIGSLQDGATTYGQRYDLGQAMARSQYSGHQSGQKQYELSDHLGNVLATVLDRKVGVGQVSNPDYPAASSAQLRYDHWDADIASVQDYYPFGMPMDGGTNTARSYSPERSKFGFNGQRRDDEVYGVGMLNTAQFWEYDTRLARRWNLDPQSQIFISDYATFGNNPVVNNDVLGNIFDVATDSKTKTDVMSLVSHSNQRYVSISSTGNVSINFPKKFSEKQILRIVNADEGLHLVKDLVDGHKKFLYETSDVALIRDGKTGNNTAHFLYNEANGMGSINASDNGLDSKNTLTDLPKLGYNGQVVIDPNSTYTETNEYGDEVSKSRNTYIFHELAENYERTENGVNYNGENGAHNKASERERKWNKKSEQPGGFRNASTPPPSRDRRKELQRVIEKWENK